MKVAIISNTLEGKGLAVDARILDRLLTSWDHEVFTFDFRSITKDTIRCHLVLHLEMPQRRALHWSDRHWLFANPDWMKKEYLEWLPAFERIYAKTHDATERLAKLSPRVEYIGFESEDKLRPRIPRERRYFHSWCGSIVKGTHAVQRAWDKHYLLYPKTFFVDKRAEDSLYLREQNRCRYWIQPSQTEGFGHIIHEGLSVGAIIATTDAPPMNESPGIAFRIPSRKVATQNAADVYDCRPDDIAATVDRMWALTDAEITDLSGAARAAFELERAEFRERLRAQVEG